MPSEEQLAMLKRIVTDPMLVSDGTLRAAIASLMNWSVDPRYFIDSDKPWGHGYAPGRVNDRLDDLEEAVSLIRGHLVL